MSEIILVLCAYLAAGALIAYDSGCRGWKLFLYAPVAFPLALIGPFFLLLLLLRSALRKPVPKVGDRVRIKKCVSPPCDKHGSHVGTLLSPDPAWKVGVYVFDSPKVPVHAVEVPDSDFLDKIVRGLEVEVVK